MALDLKTHRIYLAAVEFGAVPKPTSEQPHPRPSIVPGSFVILAIPEGINMKRCLFLILTASDLIKHGRVIRPWLGVNGKQVKKELMEIINLPLVEGFLVETVEPGSPAQQAEIHGGELSVTIGGSEFLIGGDIITEINGQSIKGPGNFLKGMASLKVGDRINLTLFNKKKTRHIELTLPERPILPADIRTSFSSSLQPTRGRFLSFPLQ